MPFVRRRPLVIFFVLAVLIAFGAMAIRALDPGALGAAFGKIMANNERADIITGVRYSLETPVLWNALLFPAAPTIAAAIVLLLGWGPKGLARWGARIAPWRGGVSWRQGVGVWLLVATAFLAWVGVVALYATDIGQTAALQSLVDRYGGGSLAAVGLLALSLVLSSGPLLEEMGWRGFALPLLLQRFTPVAASVAVGVIWAAWHLPREVSALATGGAEAWVSFAYRQVNFVPGCVAGSIIATFLYFKLGGSVWGGVLAHALHNELVVNVARVDVPLVKFGDLAVSGWTLAEIGVALALIVLTQGKLGAVEDTRKAPHPFG